MFFRRLCRAAPIFIVVFLLLLYRPSAFAERPADSPEKGAIPAGACVLVPQADHDDCEPVPVEINNLYIGLDYGNEAVYEASFVNASGQGFALGSFDKDRIFHEESILSASEIRVRAGESWFVLLNEIYSKPEDASAAADNFGGTVMKLDGALRVLIGGYAERWEADYLIRYYALPGKAWQAGGISIYDRSGHLLRLFADRSEIAVQAVSDGVARTSYRGESYSGAFILRKGEENRLTVINAVGLEDYVKGVIPYEMSPSWPFEALKAQAVCARTYAAYHLNEYDEDYGFDLTDDTESQVYRGLNGADTVTDAAVDATCGQFVRYKGELCEIYYFSSDGGATEDGINIFGNDRPYLAGKTDPFEQAVDFAVMRWERFRSTEEITRRLQDKGYEIGTVTDLKASYSELGNVIGMSYTDENGVCLSLSGRDSYLPLSLDSARFEIEPQDGGFRFSGIGWGHNCGMSQWGAYAMAEHYGLSAEEIISFYFTGARIA